MTETHELKSLAVFCGSSLGSDPAYTAAAAQVADLLAREGIGIVFGGGHVGLMGVVADAALAAGGRVTGVIPRSLVEREIAHSGVSDLRVVETMHERKAVMAELSDAFLALPGGAGTLEEISEQWTWAQLGTHDKPCGFLNVRGFFDPLQDFVSRMHSEGFLKTEHSEMLHFSTEVDEVLRHFRAYAPPASAKWVPSSQTGNS